MATVTASLIGPSVKAVHTGIVCTGAALAQRTTLTASSVILLNTIPNGATLVDWWFRYTDGAADQGLEIGTSNSPSGIMAMTTLTITISMSGLATEVRLAGPFNSYRCAMGGDLMPVRISLSDDVQPASVQLRMTLRAGISASADLTWMLFYTMDGLPGHTTIR